MKGKFIIISVLLAIIIIVVVSILVINNNKSENEGTKVAEETTNTDKLYTWKVGNYTLETKTNVMDYIEGDVWKANEMATALGWNPMAYSGNGTGVDNSDNYKIAPNAKNPAYFLNGNVFIRQGSASPICNNFSVHIKGERQICVIAAASNYGEYKYKENGGTTKWSLEEIICFAYACENISSDNTENPFEGILYEYDKKSNTYRYDK